MTTSRKVIWSNRRQRDEVFEQEQRSLRGLTMTTRKFREVDGKNKMMINDPSLMILNRHLQIRENAYVSP